MTHICICKLIIIGSDNRLSPGQRQAIIWTNAGILLIGPLGTNFSEILIKTCRFSFKKIYLKMSSGKWRPSCLGLNEVLTPVKYKCDICQVILNTLRPRQNGPHFADDIFKCIFLNENIWISIKISLKFVPKGPINNIPAVVQIMAWCCSGNKPLSSQLTYICVTRPQWVNMKKIISQSWQPHKQKWYN